MLTTFICRKTFQGFDIFLELSDIIVNRNASACKQVLELSKSHISELACLGQSQAFILEKPYRQFLPKLRFGHACCSQQFLWQGKVHFVTLNRLYLRVSFGQPWLG